MMIHVGMKVHVYLLPLPGEDSLKPMYAAVPKGAEARVSSYSPASGPDECNVGVQLAESIEWMEGGGFSGFMVRECEIALVHQMLPGLGDSILDLQNAERLSLTLAEKCSKVEA